MLGAASSLGMVPVFRIRRATEANSGATVSRCFGLHSSGLTPCVCLVDRSVSDVLSQEHLLVEVRRRNLPHPTSKFGAQSRLDLGPVMFDMTQLVPRPCHFSSPPTHSASRLRSPQCFVTRLTATDLPDTCVHVPRILY